MLRNWASELRHWRRLPLTLSRYSWPSVALAMSSELGARNSYW